VLIFAWRDGCHLRRSIALAAYAYPGNRPDVTQFPAMIDIQMSRYATLATGATDPQATVLFEPGRTRRRLRPPDRHPPAVRRPGATRRRPPDLGDRPKHEVFGKQTLATDRDDWTRAEVITAYGCRPKLSPRSGRSGARAPSPSDPCITRRTTASGSTCSPASSPSRQRT
jgi:hypothetical protein